MFGAWAVPLKRCFVYRTRVALVGVEAVRGKVLRHRTHLTISTYFGEDACRGNRQAVRVGLDHHFGVGDDTRQKVPRTVDNGCVNRDTESSHRPARCEPLGISHAEVVALLPTGRTNGPGVAPFGHAIEEELSFSFGEHFGVSYTVHATVTGQERCAHHQWTGPCSSPNLVDTNDVVVPLGPQRLLGAARRRDFLRGCLRPNHTRTVACSSMTKPTVTIPDDLAPAELVIVDDVIGEGATAASGQSVMVHYVGVAWSTGAQFDASWDRMEPFEFRLGAGQVITGWDKGVAGMKVGGRRTLTIPPHLGYGARGAGGVIKGNETLVFVVDLLSVS